MRLELGQRLGGQLLVHEFVADPGQQNNAFLLMGERGMVDNVLRAPEHLVWMRARLDEGEFRVARAVVLGWYRRVMLPRPTHAGPPLIKSEGGSPGGSREPARRGLGLVLGVTLRVDGDALRRVLGGCGLRHCHREHAVLERRLRSLLVDLEGQRQAALEAAVVAFAEAPALVPALGLRLAADGEHVVVDEELDVFLIHAGELGRDADLAIRGVHLEARPAPAPCARPACGPVERCGRARVEAVEDIVEESVHFAMELEERANLVALHGAGDAGTAAAPGNEIFDSHGILLFMLLTPPSQARSLPAGSG